MIWVKSRETDFTDMARRAPLGIYHIRLVNTSRIAKCEWPALYRVDQGPPQVNNLETPLFQLLRIVPEVFRQTGKARIYRVVIVYQGRWFPGLLCFANPGVGGTYFMIKNVYAIGTGN